MARAKFTSSSEAEIENTMNTNHNANDDYAQTLQRTVEAQKEIVQMLTSILTVIIFGPLVIVLPVRYCSNFG